MNTKVKLPYGITTVTVGTMSIAVINLRVTQDFPTDELPKEVWTYESVSKTGKEYKKVEYTALESAASRKVIRQVGKLLREHAQGKLNAKYAWVDTMFQDRRIQSI